MSYESYIKGELVKWPDMTDFGEVNSLNLKLLTLEEKMSTTEEQQDTYYSRNISRITQEKDGVKYLASTIDSTKVKVLSIVYNKGTNITNLYVESIEGLYKGKQYYLTNASVAELIVINNIETDFSRFTSDKQNIYLIEVTGDLMHSYSDGSAYLVRTNMPTQSVTQYDNSNNLILDTDTFIFSGTANTMNFKINSREYNLPKASETQTSIDDYTVQCNADTILPTFDKYTDIGHIMDEIDSSKMIYHGEVYINQVSLNVYLNTFTCTYNNKTMIALTKNFNATIKKTTDTNNLDPILFLCQRIEGTTWASNIRYYFPDQTTNITIKEPQEITYTEGETSTTLTGVEGSLKGTLIRTSVEQTGSTGTYTENIAIKLTANTTIKGQSGKTDTTKTVSKNTEVQIKLASTSTISGTLTQMLTIPANSPIYQSAEFFNAQYTYIDNDNTEVITYDNYQDIVVTLTNNTTTKVFYHTDTDHNYYIQRQVATKATFSYDNKDVTQVIPSGEDPVVLALDHTTKKSVYYLKFSTVQEIIGQQVYLLYCHFNGSSDNFISHADFKAYVDSGSKYLDQFSFASHSITFTQPSDTLYADQTEGTVYLEPITVKEALKKLSVYCSLLQNDKDSLTVIKKTSKVNVETDEVKDLPFAVNTPTEIQNETITRTQNIIRQNATTKKDETVRIDTLKMSPNLILYASFDNEIKSKKKLTLYRSVNNIYASYYYYHGQRDAYLKTSDGTTIPSYFHIPLLKRYPFVYQKSETSEELILDNEYSVNYECKLKYIRIRLYNSTSTAKKLQGTIYITAQTIRFVKSSSGGSIDTTASVFSNWKAETDNTASDKTYSTSTDTFLIPKTTSVKGRYCYAIDQTTTGITINSCSTTWVDISCPFFGGSNRYQYSVISPYATFTVPIYVFGQLNSGGSLKVFTNLGEEKPLHPITNVLHKSIQLKLIDENNAPYSFESAEFKEKSTDSDTKTVTYEDGIVPRIAGYDELGQEVANWYFYDDLYRGNPDTQTTETETETETESVSNDTKQNLYMNGIVFYKQLPSTVRVEVSYQYVSGTPYAERWNALTLDLSSYSYVNDFITTTKASITLNQLLYKTAYVKLQTKYKKQSVCFHYECTSKLNSFYVDLDNLSNLGIEQCVRSGILALYGSSTQKLKGIDEQIVETETVIPFAADIEGIRAIARTTNLITNVLQVPVRFKRKAVSSIKEDDDINNYYVAIEDFIAQPTTKEEKDPTTNKTITVPVDEKSHITSDTTVGYVYEWSDYMASSEFSSSAFPTAKRCETYSVLQTKNIETGSVGGYYYWDSNRLQLSVVPSGNYSATRRLTHLIPYKDASSFIKNMQSNEYYCFASYTDHTVSIWDNVSTLTRPIIGVPQSGTANYPTYSEAKKITYDRKLLTVCFSWKYSPYLSGIRLSWSTA